MCTPLLVPDADYWCHKYLFGFLASCSLVLLFRYLRVMKFVIWSDSDWICVLLCWFFKWKMNVMLDVFLFPWRMWSWFLVGMGCKFGFPLFCLSNFLIIIYAIFIILVIIFLFMWVWWIFIDLVCYQIWCFYHTLILSSNFYILLNSFDMMIFKVMDLNMFADMYVHCEHLIGRLVSQSSI